MAVEVQRDRLRAFRKIRGYKGKEELGFLHPGFIRPSAKGIRCCSFISGLLGRYIAELCKVLLGHGYTGGAVASSLLDRGFPVRALTRDPGKPEARDLGERGAEVVRGDLDDRSSVDQALEGACGVFSMQNFWEIGYDREVRQGVMLADAAHAADVAHFVYSSVGCAYRETGIPHFDSKWEIEEHVRGLGLPYTILRPVFFMQNWEMMRA